MARISERISAAISNVECPGCGKRVVPTMMNAPAAPTPPVPQPGEAEEGKRWSFIWRPPSGKVCPECFFPLERYVRRLKWIRTFSAGLVLLVVALMLLILSLLNPDNPWAGSGARIVAGVGGIVLVVGLIGIIVGGSRKGDEQTPP